MDGSTAFAQSLNDHLNQMETNKYSKKNDGFPQVVFETSDKRVLGKPISVSVQQNFRESMITST